MNDDAYERFKKFLIIIYLIMTEIKFSHLIWSRGKNMDDNGHIDTNRIFFFFRLCRHDKNKQDFH